ncbi:MULTISPECIES: acyltransferase family protein [Bradyrhizobium]|uniref:Acyltransferase n=1 Tax=Bradyrhizobium arachidis TaxID=858423 RepID=A0AAE7NKE1_9BRAD|nr:MULTISPECIES: acyltransferase [Bradyrhizobium]QOG21658.1 acyltransferase family protein [Bradyrhizobium sp. SEMIA]QOZ66957.1 acyltransferase [Bradyrhizobium arachidis]UFW51660.1 acyltransferase [Bradyrhizobium arachidis]SFV17209.1 Peptidoglycan/LPS O-acetylase OafA/YrhL, contains acyltransferase and SGNH-hydrolase domains [Bradyrhizobium arachidis]
MQGQARLAAGRSERGATPFSRSHTLDFLRGLAILGVIAIHVSQSFPSNIHAIDYAFMCGWTGVNVFYFVSAMTMCLMWTQRAGETSPTRKFYIRRALRIAPLFWLAIPVYLVLNGTGPSYNAPNGIGPLQVILTATFLHGFWPDSVNSVVPGDWSIAAEMTFYLVFPLLITAFGSRRSLYLALALLLHLVNVCLFKPWAFELFSAYYGPAHASFVWSTLHISFLNQLPVFLIGCALFFSLRDGFTRSDGAIFIVFVVLSFFANRATGAHEFNYLIINLVLGAMVAGCIRFAVHWSPIEALGRNSYSMYLSHFAVTYALHRVWPLADGLASLLMTYVVTIALSYLLARATWHLVERHTQDLAQRLTSSASTRPAIRPVVAATATGVH